MTERERQIRDALIQALQQLQAVPNSRRQDLIQVPSNLNGIVRQDSLYKKGASTNDRI